MMEIKWGQYPGGCQDAFRIRKTVFMEEQGFANEFDEIDQTCEHLTLYLDGEPAGCARIYQEGEKDRWHLGRVAVLEKFRSRGLGAVLVKEAEQRAAALGGSSVYLSAQMQAKGFYEKLGYAAVTGTYLDEHCPHVGMEKNLPPR